MKFPNLILAGSKAGCISTKAQDDSLKVIIKDVLTQ
jgi:hypothetical protein